jgi:TolA-binding protein
MRKSNLALAIAAVLILSGFAYIAMRSGAVSQKLHMKTIKLQSTEQKLKSINIQYDKLDTQLKIENSNNQDNQEKIDDLKRQQDQLQKDKQELEAKLQAKAAEKQRLAAAAEKAAQQATATRVAQAAAARPTGDKANWLVAAGIPESDWPYVECVINGCQGVSAEGGWGGTLRWNTTGSGAYGLCQSLPASKMASAGADYMTNPITQLRWCNGYAQAYGGWANAWNFRKCLGRCYSTRTGGYVIKDHTWW